MLELQVTTNESGEIRTRLEDSEGKVYKGRFLYDTPIRRLICEAHISKDLEVYGPNITYSPSEDSPQELKELGQNAATPS